MESPLIDRRRKLTYENKREIHRRFFNRSVSGETVESIAKDFGIHRQVASRVAREFVDVQADASAKDEIAPES